jgi:hypothetical protein
VAARGAGATAGDADFSGSETKTLKACALPKGRSLSIVAHEIVNPCVRASVMCITLSAESPMLMCKASRVDRSNARLQRAAGLPFSWPCLRKSEVMVSEKDNQAPRDFENGLALAKERRLTGGIIRERVENRTEARGTGAHMLHRYYCDEELLKRLWRTPETP